MKQIKTIDDIKQLSTILVVGAHPDDESFLCAGLMAAAIQNGQTVVCITATKGEEGVQDETRWPRARLGEIREQEMDQALAALGCQHHHWLNYHDAQLPQVKADDAVAKIKQFIEKYQPDTILTFGPDGLTGHPDHQTVSLWTDTAVRGTDIKVYHAVESKDRYEKYLVDIDKQFDFYFNIDKPPVLEFDHCTIAFRLTPDILNKKRQALTAMPSQTERLFRSLTTEAMDGLLSEECFVLNDHNLI